MLIRIYYAFTRDEITRTDHGEQLEDKIINGDKVNSRHLCSVQGCMQLRERSDNQLNHYSYIKQKFISATYN